MVSTDTEASTISIAGRSVGQGQPCLVIGEVGLAHDGSLGLAHAFIDAIAHAGADAVKFQTHLAAAESTKDEPFRVKFSSQDTTRYDYWQRTEFTLEQWRELAKHAARRGLLFLSTPFSSEAVELLSEVGVPAWKIGSGETASHDLIEAVASTNLPVLLSTGMSSLAETDAAIALLQKKGVPHGVFQCTTAYPCPPEKIGLNMIRYFRDRYACPIGLSDHSGTIFSGLAARVIGIDALEVHVALSREMFGADVPASVTTTELSQLVDGIRFIERLLDADVDKDALSTEMEPLRHIFNKSVVPRTDLPAGTIIRESHLATKKPGTGIPANDLKQLVGLRLKRAVVADQILQPEDIENYQRELQSNGEVDS